VYIFSSVNKMDDRAIQKHVKSVTSQTKYAVNIFWHFKSNNTNGESLP